MACPDLGGGGEREILRVDVGCSHQAQQLGRERRVEARGQVAPQHGSERGPGAGQVRIEREGATARASRTSQVTLLPTQAAKVKVRLRQALVQSDRALEGLLRLSAPAKLVEDVAEIIVKSWVFRRYDKRAAIGGEGFLMPSHAAQRAALAVERFDPVGTVRKRALEGFQGALPASLPRQSAPQIQRRIRVAGCGGEDTTEALLRIFRSMEAKQHHTLIEKCDHRSRLEPGRLAVGGERRLEIRGLLQHQPEMQMAGRGLGVRRDRTAKERMRLRRIAALVPEQSQVVERLRLVRRLPEN